LRSAARSKPRQSLPILEGKLAQENAVDQTEDAVLVTMSKVSEGMMAEPSAMRAARSEVESRTPPLGETHLPLLGNSIKVVEGDGMHSALPSKLEFLGVQCPLQTIA
jgi:hypothetical protein